jgi:acyl-coenzyme A thioesterase PaaI-like protein
LKAKRWQDSTAETVQVVLPNDSNPLGFILGGTVMHLIDITGAIACHRHTNTLALTAPANSTPNNQGKLNARNQGKFGAHLQARRSTDRPGGRQRHLCSYG